MAYDQYKVSVVVPTLDEAQNIPLIFPRIPLDVVDEVVLVDGRSTDNTVAVARQLLPGLKLVLESKPGKGAALRAGYRAATGDIIVVIDADGSNDPREIPRYVRSLVEGADFVKGSRFAHRGGTTDMPRYRQFGNGVFVLLVNLLFGSAFTDLCYGFHSFWRYCLDVIDVEDADGFEIDTALYLRAVRERLRIVEVPSFEGYRFYGTGKLQTIPDGWRVLRTILAEWYSAVTNTQPHADYLGFRDQPAELAVAWPTTRRSGGNFDPDATIPGRVQAAVAPDSERMDVQLLVAVSQAVALEGSLRVLLQQALRLTLVHSQAVSGSILVLNEQGAVLDGCRMHNGAIDSLLPASDNELVERGLAGWVVRNRRPALVASTRDDPRWLRRGWERQEGKARSAMCVPLIVHGRAIGALTLAGDRPGQFTHRDLNRLAALAATAS